MTEDTGHKLLPCPFCGGEAKHCTTYHDSDSQEEIQCTGCGAEVVFWLPWTAGDKEKAAAINDVCERWNKRANDGAAAKLEEFHTWERTTDRFAALRAENERLRTALKPFAELGMAMLPDGASDDSVWVTSPDKTPVNNITGFGFTFGDFRRAALERKPE
jgi:hypothetical protein